VSQQADDQKGVTLLVSSYSCHCIYKVQLVFYNANNLIVMEERGVSIFAGKKGEEGDADGLENSVRLRHPQGLALFEDSLLVCDNGNQSVRLVSNAVPLADVLCSLADYAGAFGLMGVSCDLNECVEKMSSFLDIVEEMEVETEARCGKVASAQGPDGIFSSSLRKSVKVAVLSMEHLRLFLTGQGVLPEDVDTKSLTTLVAECFFGEMRVTYPMPSQKQYLERRSGCITEMEKRHSLTPLFPYFTGPDSYYQRPDSIAKPSGNEKRFVQPVSSNIYQHPKVDLESIQKLHSFVSRCDGNAAVQSTVRALSTKEVTGREPYSKSWKPKPVTRARNDSEAIDVMSGLPAQKHFDNSRELFDRTTYGSILYRRGEFVALHAPKSEPNSFWLCRVDDDVTDDVKRNFSATYLEEIDVDDQFYSDNDQAHACVAFFEKGASSSDFYLPMVIGAARMVNVAHVFGIDESEVEKIEWIIREQKDEEVKQKEELRQEKRKADELDAADPLPKKSSSNRNPLSSSDRPVRSSATYFSGK
jgi:hypothetical protein